MAAITRKKERKARLTADDLRALAPEELRNKLAENQEELMRARFKHATATLEDTAELKAKRRQIARIATILKEKEERV